MTDKAIIVHWNPWCENIPYKDSKGPYLSIKNLEFEYIDRGIKSFSLFASDIRRMFPNIETLFLEQNYSWEASVNNFYDFIIDIFSSNTLKRFIMIDSQSEFIEHLDKYKFFDLLPTDAVIIIKADIETDVITKDGKGLVFINNDEDPLGFISPSVLTNIVDTIKQNEPSDWIFEYITNLYKN